MQQVVNFWAGQGAMSWVEALLSACEEVAWPITHLGARVSGASAAMSLLRASTTLPGTVMSEYVDVPGGGEDDAANH
jgi:hypothetical protein